MKNLKGLSITSIISIILAVAIIGVGIAWWLMSSDNDNINTNNQLGIVNTNFNSNTNQPIAVNAEPSTINTNTTVNTNSVTNTTGCANVTEDWLTYTNEIYNYTLRYPVGWTYEETDLSAEESATGWPFRYVTFQDADGVYSFTVGVRQVGDDIGVAPRTGLGYGEMIAGDLVSIGSTTTTPQIHRVDGTTDVILYYESTSTAPILSGHDIVAEISSTSDDVLEESAEFQTANSILCTMEFEEA